MKRIVLSLSLLVGFAIFWAGCDALGGGGGEETASTVIVEGRVTDASGSGVAGARVIVPPTEADREATGENDPPPEPYTARTDTSGSYSLIINVNGGTEINIRAVKGELEAARVITVFPGQTRTGVDFVLGGSGGGTENAEPTTVTGQVTNIEGGPPKSNARVVVTAGAAGGPYSARVDSVTGAYRLVAQVTGSTELTIKAMSDQFSAMQIVTVFPNETRGNVDFVLGGSGEDGDGGGGNEESGTPSTIQLLSVSRTTIGIQGSGAPETSQITYQVVDSAGRPVTLDHETPVRFSLSGASPQGASIAPKEATTNNEGKVTVNLSSGTAAGTVQIIAEATAADGSAIRSVPVSVTIHGGLPDQEHFSIAAERNNVQGLVVNGLEIPVSVIVGDQYSNPVKPGTSVYFETTGGVVEGSILTDEQGRGTVTLISANPRPDDGVVVVTASTQNRDGQRIEVKTPVLFTSGSRVKVISLPDTVFAQPLNLNDPEDVEKLYDALGSHFLFGGYRFIVTDRNGNPLPGGTTITFEAGGTEVGAEGSYTLRRTLFTDQNGDGDILDHVDVVRGLGITEFSGAAASRDNPDTLDQPDLESFTITIQAPQTQRSYTFVEPDSSRMSSSASMSQVVLYKNGEPAATLENGELMWKQ